MAYRSALFVLFSVLFSSIFVVAALQVPSEPALISVEPSFSHEDEVETFDAHKKAKSHFGKIRCYDKDTCPVDEAYRISNYLIHALPKNVTSVKGPSAVYVSYYKQARVYLTLNEYGQAHVNDKMIGEYMNAILRKCHKNGKAHGNGYLLPADYKSSGFHKGPNTVWVTVSNDKIKTTGS